MKTVDQPAFAPLRAGALTSPVLQRRCDCGATEAAGGECSACRKHALQRRASGNAVVPDVPASVHATLGSSGSSLDPATRAFMEHRLGHDFSGVRVHADAAAGESARAIDAQAYTVGRHVVFGAGHYAPRTDAGKRLLAHELTHVVQQRGAGSVPQRLAIDAPDSASEREAERAGERVLDGAVPIAAQVGTPRIARRDAHIADSTTLTMNLGNTPRTGLQFTPTNVTDTRVGPVGARPGLLDGGASRLNVIVGENLTLNALAVQLLPLWTTATPFTPPGAAAPLPLDIITADELARGLITYNRYYLGLPSMTKWRSGLRFPLPVDIDAASGVATVHPLTIRALASGFDAAWVPLLETRASATAAPAAATLQSDVQAFLAQRPDALSRGIALNARALTNAVAERPFVQEVFRQLAPAARFDVALAFIDSLVNRERDVLAAQRDGFDILVDLSVVIASPPAVLSQKQQESLTRADNMIGIVTGAAAAPPEAMRSNAVKTFNVDTVKLVGSNRDPEADMRQAASMFEQCNVRLNHAGKHIATPQQTTDWIGGDGIVTTASCSGSPEQRRLSVGANSDFNLGSRIRVFYVPALSTRDRASSCPPAGIPTLFKGVTWLGNHSEGRTLGHEIGHQLIDSGPGVDDHPRRQPTRLMATSNDTLTGETLIDSECTRIYRNA